MESKHFTSKEMTEAYAEYERARMAAAEAANKMTETAKQLCLDELKSRGINVGDKFMVYFGATEREMVFTEIQSVSVFDGKVSQNVSRVQMALINKDGSISTKGTTLYVEEIIRMAASR